MYTSKNDIYTEFPIAVKLGLRQNGSQAYVGTGAYEDLYDQLNKKHRILLNSIGEALLIQKKETQIKAFNKEHPISYGVFFEVQQQSPTGENIGVQFVFLRHETGPELFFLGLGSAVMLSLIIKFGEAVVDKMLEKLVEKFFQSVTSEWKSILPPSVQIEYLEIRTAEKGVMRILFDDFKIAQLQCLIKKFNLVKRIDQTNSACFANKLFYPPGTQMSPGFNSQSND
jgi:hypothetical protein